LAAAVTEREQAEREEQQWQEEDVATAHYEHDHGNCKADRKHTHQTDLLMNEAVPGERPGPASNLRA
jgi:hypothetical protein